MHRKHVGGCAPAAGLAEQPSAAQGDRAELSWPFQTAGTQVTGVWEAVWRHIELEFHHLPQERNQHAKGMPGTAPAVRGRVCNGMGVQWCRCASLRAL